MGSIFINYRREQTAGEAMALFNQLATTIGKDSVFMDVANIDLGRDFRQALHDRLASCDLMLALIGRGWAEATNASGHRRLDDPNDYVRLEITAALKRNIPVLPVLVQGVQMPAMEMLPEEMRDFAFRNAFELSHSRWDSDVHEMLKRLGLGNQQGVGSIAEPGAPVGKASTDGASTAVRGSAAEAGATHPLNRKPWLAIAAATLAALALAGGGLLYMRTVAERDAKIEQAKVEGARAKDAADAQLVASRAEAARARADAQAASAAVAAAQAEKEIAAARAKKEIEAAVLAERNRAVAQAAKDRETTAQAQKPATPAQPTRPKSATPAAAPTSDVQTLLKTAKALERGDGVARDYVEAARLYRIAAEQGNPVAQYSLGRMYRSGLGVPKDDAQASTLYRKSATQGNADAQYALGLAYGAGQGVPKDEAEETKWYRQAASGFRRAAEQGDGHSQELLGHMYFYGRGVPKDEREALKWFRSSADQGGALGQYYVGLIYANGLGVDRDYSEAAKWYRKAADQGQVPAQHFLAELYASGRGVTKDEAEAVKWYRKAAERGFKDSQAALSKRGLTWQQAK